MDKQTLAIYHDKIKQILEQQGSEIQSDKDFISINDETKITILRELYKEDAVSHKILNSFSEKTNWRDTSLLHRVAKESAVSEREAREFLKGVLEALSLGRYIKGVHGYKSRFEWSVYEPDAYFLKNVGLAAQGQLDSLRGDGLVFSSEENNEDDDSMVDDIEMKIELPNKRTVNITYPKDITQEEYELCLSWFKLHVNSTAR